MRISKDEEIAELPATTARTLARWYRVPHVTGVAAEVLGITDAEAMSALHALAAAGYLERSGAPTDGEDFWVTTTQGNALAQASFSRPITRGTADKYVNEIVDRAGQYNADPTKLLTVNRLYVFGSYLDPGRTHVGDVDVAIDMLRRNDDDWTSQARQYVIRSGKSFKNFYAELQWPTTELVRHLRARRPAISITNDEMGSLIKDFRLIYDLSADPTAIQPSPSAGKHVM
ncbi:MarR family transcriptional regulator [Rhodococcus sp. EPR-147]|uniref:MarR family transcriptional regulator n=1 Tax=Rhodococcus sp. EPR-147 TaxID=1813676 RepID=UPI0007BC0D53|nr:helix-turn-helix domain-containing protein [Rhodococcus sp. EPR-147]KZF05182.1 hypothetical protein A2J02_24575 [Rhodococcus sp. EPR-147]